MAKPNQKKKKPVKLTPEQQKKAAAEKQAKLRKRQHIRAIRDVFTNSGFKHITGLSKTDFHFKGKQCDFDEVFVLENVLVLVEHTAHGEDHVSTHLAGKATIFGYIAADPHGFAKYARSNFPEIDDAIDKKYADHNVVTKIIYCSLNSLKDSTKSHTPNVNFLDYPYLRYFLLLSRAIKLSARYEVLDFVGVSPVDYGDGTLAGAGKKAVLPGSILPESQSHLPPGYKVMSFYVSAGELIKRAYVLRRDSWRVGANIYQRLVIKKKLDSIRKHLLGGKGAFLNNIIAALPDSTKILDDHESQIDPSKIFKVTPCKVELTEDFNSVALIDGQHRVFSYFEGGSDEEAIAVLRSQQNLLVTGVVLPKGTSDVVRNRFAASLFLQINANQTNARPELIQDIGVILRPFAVGSVARRILWKLNERGPFRHQFQTPFSEGEKVKTASIVNYGLVSLVRPGSAESLFKYWGDPDKESLVKGQDDPSIPEDAIERYVEFCATEINKFVGAVKVCSDDGRWTPSRKVPDRLLTTTIINGMIHCQKRLAATGKLGTHDYYVNALKNVGTFNFGLYTSSHYSEMGLDLAKEYFGA